MPEQQIPVQLEPQHFALTNVNISFSDEEFIFGMIAGQQMRVYHASPKHAKRLMLLLQKQVEAYEKTIGQLQAGLPQNAVDETKAEIGFAA